MSCQYCGSTQDVPQPAVSGNYSAGGMPGNVREIPIEEGMRLAARGLGGAQVTTVACQDCGAMVNVGEGERTAKCAFCGSESSPRETDANAIRPESLVAFQIDKESANKKFAEWLSGLWFRPNDLKRMANVQEMGGVYVPFWTFDAHVDSQWTADAGYYYYETEYYTETADGETVERSRQVQYTRWEPAWGQRHDFYDDVLICASKGLPQDLIEQFGSFDTQKLTPYAPQFLAGWRAEAYAIDLMAGHNVAREKMNSSQVSKCARDVPGDTHRNLSVNNHFHGETFKHVLLPIWIAAYRYNNKVFRFLVNGQTGEVVGKAPYSIIKIVLFTLACLAIISTIGYFVVSAQQPKDPTPTKKKKATADEEAPAPKKKTTKKKSSGTEGSLDPRPHFRGLDGRVVVVPV